MVDALDLGSSKLSLWRFEPSPRYKANKKLFAFLVLKRPNQFDFSPATVKVNLAWDDTFCRVYELIRI